MARKLGRRSIGLACLFLGLSRPVFGQMAPDVAMKNAMFHFGPLAVTPRLAVQDLGVDTNVFNSSTNQVRDTTAGLVPGAEVWLQVGRALISSQTTVEWLYYRQSASQRSVNFGETLRVDVDLTRVVPRVSGVYVNTRRRPNDEIDQRVQEKRAGAAVGSLWHTTTRFDAEADLRRTRYDYLEGQYGDPRVARALNRDSDEINLTGRFEVTSLTSLAVRADWIRDRFVYTPERDSDSLRVMPGVVFQPFALVSGSAFVGMRRFVTVSPEQPDYSGLVAAIELKYTALDRFRLIGKARRDVDYSLDLTEPYYVSSSVGAEALQVIGLNWDVVGHVRYGALDYPAVAANQQGRTDHVKDFGAGFGRRLGDQLRVGVDVNYVIRTSVLPDRAYEGLRVGGSFVYGY